MKENTDDWWDKKKRGDRRDIQYPQNLKEGDVDMSPEAVTDRMVAFAELCELCQKLNIEDAEYFQVSTELICLN